MVGRRRRGPVEPGGHLGPAGRRGPLLRTGRRFDYGRSDWSPDGRRLAVVRTDLHTTPAVYTVRRDGSGLRRVFDPATLAPPASGLDAYVSERVSWGARP